MTKEYLLNDKCMNKDPSNLDFTISEATGTATDNLANNYELRKIQ